MPICDLPTITIGIKRRSCLMLWYRCPEGQPELRMP